MLPVGAKIGSWGIKPNWITTVSLLVSCLAGLAYAMRFPILGALALLGSGFTDMLDGSVARATGMTTRFGAVYDHVLDRYAEFAILVGIGVGRYVDWIWIIFCLFGMVMASFVRAKAESVGGLKRCTVGVAERQEKLVLLLLGSFLEPLIPLALTASVVVVAILSHVTVVQRLHYTYSQTKGVSSNV